MAALRDRLARPGFPVLATQTVTNRGVSVTERIWSQASERSEAYGEEESMLGNET
jgi:hypothetical protein